MVPSDMLSEIVDRISASGGVNATRTYESLVAMLRR